MPDINLVVRVPFQHPKTGVNYEQGQVIHDPALIDAIHNGELAHLEAHCTRVQAPPAALAPASLPAVDEPAKAEESFSSTKIYSPKK